MTKRIRSRAKLANTIGLTENKLTKILRLPGAPEFNGDYDVAAVTKFVEDHADEIGGDASEELKRVRIEEIKIRCHRLRRQVERDDGLWILKTEVAAAMDRILAPMVQRLSEKLENEYPAKVSGLSIPEARTYGKRTLDDILAAFRSFADEWKAL